MLMKSCRAGARRPKEDLGRGTPQTTDLPMSICDNEDWRFSFFRLAWLEFMTLVCLAGLVFQPDHDPDLSTTFSFSTLFAAHLPGSFSGSHVSACLYIICQ